MHVDDLLQTIKENELLTRWGKNLSRHPQQVNDLHQSDAELIRLPGGEKLLAATIDTISEEISLGFYQEPETIGWMGIMVSLSDLAAVGAEPLGILTSVSLPVGSSADYQEQIAIGISKACKTCGTFVLGGDTNYAARPSIGSCALGLVEAGKEMLRTGIEPGQLLYASGKLGLGTLLAAKLLPDIPADFFPEAAFRPVGRLAEAKIIREFASACMDTSDGLVVTLDQLLRLNGVGFELTTPITEVVHPGGLKLSGAISIHPFTVLSCLHGEFELIFTVPIEKREEFEKSAAAQDFSPILLGKSIEEPKLILEEAGQRRDIDSGAIHNLWDNSGGDLKRYLSELIRLASPA
ncbi:thiamine-monophosphate kinase [Candidatus Riflebacteria bacterium]